MVILIREPSIAVSLIIMALTICQAKPVKAFATEGDIEWVG